MVRVFLASGDSIIPVDVPDGVRVSGTTAALRVLNQKGELVAYFSKAIGYVLNPVPTP